MVMLGGSAGRLAGNRQASSAITTGSAKVLSRARALNRPVGDAYTGSFLGELNSRTQVARLRTPFRLVERSWSLAGIRGAVEAPPFVRDEAELAFAAVPKQVSMVTAQTRDPGEVKARVSRRLQRFVKDCT
jgi:hypothetical protein